MLSMLQRNSLINASADQNKHIQSRHNLTRMQILKTFFLSWKNESERRIKNTNVLGQDTLTNRAWCSASLLSQKRGHL